MTAPHGDAELATKLIAACDHERMRKLGADSARPAVTVGEDPYREAGRLVVSGWKFDTMGLALRIDVSSSQKELEIREEKEERDGVKDLIEVIMERPQVKGEPLRIITIAVVEPSTDENHALIEATYSLADLCTLVKVKAAPSAGETMERIRLACPEVGIRGIWHKAASVSFHSSGGVEGRQGSGPIRLRQPTEEDFAETETVRSSNWNLAELLGEDRPVYKRFPKLLVKGKQIATSLEVEVEYAVAPDVLARVVKVMGGLAGDKTPWDKLGIRAITTEKKTTTDHYYDLPDCPLLRGGFVLRHRSASSDPDGTWLLAVKGRQVGMPGRRIRLTAQADLNGAVATQLESLKGFLADTGVDNPVARTLRDAVGGYDKLIGASPIAERFTLESTRTRYEIELDDSVMVEFSADVSTARAGHQTVELHAFEFGLAHPGLYVAPGTASSGGTMSGPIGSAKQSAGVHSPQTPQPAYSRTYHVPDDLDQSSLFEERDFVRFHRLVDDLITQVLQLDRASLEIGGDKGRQAAKRLGLLG